MSKLNVPAGEYDYLAAYGRPRPPAREVSEMEAANNAASDAAFAARQDKLAAEREATKQAEQTRLAAEAEAEQVAFENHPLVSGGGVRMVENMTEGGYPVWVSAAEFQATFPTARVVGNVVKCGPYGYGFAWR